MKNPKVAVITLEEQGEINDTKFRATIHTRDNDGSQTSHTQWRINDIIASTDVNDKSGELLAEGYIVKLDDVNPTRVLGEIWDSIVASSFLTCVICKSKDASVDMRRDNSVDVHSKAPFCDDCAPLFAVPEDWLEPDFEHGLPFDPQGAVLRRKSDGVEFEIVSIGDRGVDRYELRGVVNGVAAGQVSADDILANYRVVITAENIASNIVKKNVLDEPTGLRLLAELESLIDILKKITSTLKG